MENLSARPVSGFFLLVILLFCCLLVPATRIAGAENDSLAAKSQFVIRLRPARPSGAATEEEKAKILQHFEYLQGLLAEGKLLLAGLATDDHAGIVVVEAEGRLEAEKMMVMDPAVRSGVFLAELHPFRVALMAGRQ